MSSFLIFGDKMQQLVDVCINIPTKQINKVFTYSLPDIFTAVDLGWRVIVPFAGNDVEGFVIKKYYGYYENDDLKAVIDSIDDKAWFDEKMLVLAKWLSDYYMCTLAEAMRLFLPGKKSLSRKFFYSLNDEKKLSITSEYEKQLFLLLENKKQVTKERIKAEIGTFDERLIAKLVRKNELLTTKQLKNRFSKQFVTDRKSTRLNSSH